MSRNERNLPHHLEPFASHIEIRKQTRLRRYRLPDHGKFHPKYLLWLLLPSTFTRAVLVNGKCSPTPSLSPTIPRRRDVTLTPIDMQPRPRLRRRLHLRPFPHSRMASLPRRNVRLHGSLRHSPCRPRNADVWYPRDERQNRSRSSSQSGCSVYPRCGVVCRKYFWALLKMMLVSGGMEIMDGEADRK